MKIILINGPSRSGKDTAALAIKSLLSFPKFENFTFEFDRFSLPIKHAFAGLMGAMIDDFGNVEHYEEIKEQVIPELGVSYRQWQIDFSERFMKPLYGENIFGRLFIQRARDIDFNSTHGFEPVIVVPDCGFQIELETVLAAFDREDIALIRVMRPGFDFTGDSREYVSVQRGKEGNAFRCAYFPLVNKDLDLYRRDVQRVVSYFLKGE